MSLGRDDFSNIIHNITNLNDLYTTYNSFDQSTRVQLFRDYVEQVRKIVNKQTERRPNVQDVTKVITAIITAFNMIDKKQTPEDRNGVAECRKYMDERLKNIYDGHLVAMRVIFDLTKTIPSYHDPTKFLKRNVSADGIGLIDVNHKFYNGAVVDFDWLVKETVEDFKIHSIDEGHYEQIIRNAFELCRRIKSSTWKK